VGLGLRASRDVESKRIDQVNELYHPTLRQPPNTKVKSPRPGTRQKAIEIQGESLFSPKKEAVL